MSLAAHLEHNLPLTADPAMALNNYERLSAQPAAQPFLPQLLNDDGQPLQDLLQLLATSQFLADVLIHDPEALELLITPSGRSPSTAELTTLLRSEVDTVSDDANRLRILRRFRARQTLRIGINDILRDRPLEEVTRDLCRVADACLEIAVHMALKTQERKFGTPMTHACVPARITGLAFGKLGGDELNYSSDLDLMFVYDDDGETVGKRGSGTPNSEFFARVVTEVLRLISSHTDRGVAYRIDLRLRPEGHTGPLARSLASTLSYYDVMGRTWERQALIKLRHVCGDSALGREFLASIEPFIYRTYFSFSEINEVKALKRQMEARSTRAGEDDQDIKTGRGGIRDIEFTVQFLQLLNGGELRAVRQRNTLLALEALEIGGCLSANETYLLADSYRFLRKTEHRLQLLFDFQTHKLPATIPGLTALAKRMGYSLKLRHAEYELRPDAIPASTFPAQRRSLLDEDHVPAEPPKEPLDQFLKELHDKTALDRSILDHLLHQTFAGAAEKGEPESDLILDPDPDEQSIRSVLEKYHFRDPLRAYCNLSQLARESVRFLSHRRCRHFLASIAPMLLRAVAETPNPDDALENFERVTASLGAKAVLYEVFSFNPPSLKLYVDLCAGSPFLSALLMNNPGMIDELLDTLVLDQPRTRDELAAELTELLKGATDLDPILHSFQDKELLRIGVRDLLGKALIQETNAALSDLAEVMVVAVYALHEKEIVRKYGTPSAPYALVGLGKLGGREISYHSDLDLLVVYETDGMTEGEGESTSHAHFYTELAQRATRTLSQVGPMGRLYPVDMRLRPFGKSGSLVVPCEEFRRYFSRGSDARLWERQALCRARVLGTPGDLAKVIRQEVATALTAEPWTSGQTAELRSMREKLQAACGPRNLKRGPGGLVDIEFVIQLFQLKHGHKFPTILKPNVWDVFFPLRGTGLVTPTEATALVEHYTFLRSIESKLRIVTDHPYNDVPESGEQLETLARRLEFIEHGGRTAIESFLDEFRRVTTDVRKHFDAITARESAS
ncbi:[glutamate--ammonia-ligase] adenylyltransferase [soil metagenome]